MVDSKKQQSATNSWLLKTIFKQIVKLEYSINLQRMTYVLQHLATKSKCKQVTYAVTSTRKSKEQNKSSFTTNESNFFVHNCICDLSLCTSVLSLAHYSPAAPLGEPRMDCAVFHLPVWFQVPYKRNLKSHDAIN